MTSRVNLSAETVVLSLEDCARKGEPIDDGLAIKLLMRADPRPNQSHIIRVINARNRGITKHQANNAEIGKKYEKVRQFVYSMVKSGTN